MNTRTENFAWNYLSELRKELVSLQAIRSQMFGFKITFVSAMLGLTIANFEKIPPISYVIPAISAIFFDLLIHSYSFSIKRTGFYCKTHLEPMIREEFDFPKERPLWEQFSFSPAAGRNVSLLGHLGITIISLIFAIYGAVKDFNPIISIPLLLLLIILFYYDVKSLYATNVFYSTEKQFSTYLNPKPCVEILVVRNKKILLARRGEEPAKGQWDIVGGFIETNETAEDAAIRETKEETTLDIKITKYLGSIPDVYGMTQVATLNFCYLAEAENGKPIAKSDVSELKWFAINEIPEDMAFTHQTQTIKWFKEHVGSDKST